MARQATRTVNVTHVANILRTVQGATEAEYAAGLAWYEAFGSAIVATGKEHGFSDLESLAIFATLSPRSRIKANWKNFLVAIETRNASNCKPCFKTVRRKIQGILDGTMTLVQATHGDKVSRFYLNLMGMHGVVTVDTHAISCAESSVQASTSIGSGKYRQYELAYQAVAEMLEIEPCQCQAIAWLAWRRMQGIKDDGGMSLVR